MKLRAGFWRVAVCVIWIASCTKEAARDGDKDPCSPNPCKQAGKTSCEVVAKAAVCACDDGLAADGTGGCASTDSWSSGIAGRAVNSSAASEFTAHLQVVGSDDKPLEGATLRVGTRALKTDVEGRGGFTKLPTGALSAVQITAEGYAPIVRQLSIANAGLRERKVQLLELSKSHFDAGTRTVLQAGNVGVGLPARGFVGADGKRVQGKIQAQLTSFAPSALADHAWPGDRQARNAAGEPTLIEHWLGGVHAEFEDATGASLQLGPGSTAMLTIDLPADAPVGQGDSIALWALDQSSGLWLQESTCTVSAQGSGPAPRKVCSAQVSHFSTWAVGIEWDIYKPGSVGCLNVTLDVKLPEAYVANTQDIHVMQCKGEDCSQSVFWNDGQALYMSDDAGHPEALCGVASASSDVRVVVQLQVEQKERRPDAVLSSGTYMYVTEPVNLDSFKQKLGSQIMLNQTFEPASDCQLLCAQVAITLDEAALKDLPRYADEDADHSFVAATEGDTVPSLLGRADCDDSDRRVHPYAFELACGGIDYDCDGEVPPEQQVGWRDVEDPWLWNYALCPASCATRDDAETPGNLYDENCDGRIEDPDSDGYTWYGDPRDCDESSAEAHPGGQEVAGNRIDEDCDGIALDYDGDGHFAWGHEWAALEQLGVDPDKSPERFGDCHDGNPYAHPGVKLEEEVGALLDLYRRTPDGRYARTEQFCSYFNDDGKPNDWLYYLLTDRNCDGFVTDMDGDGWTDPRDQNLGAARAYDCNDLDPRVHPNEGGGGGADGKPKCEMPAASQLIDDAVCPVKGETLPEGCSPLPIDGQSLATSCYDVPNTQNLKLAFCIYDGWETGNPLKWKPGQAWGPCDGGQVLPGCPEGYMCGGKQPYSQELEKFLMDKYTGGKPIEYKGMCFKRCKLE